MLKSSSLQPNSLVMAASPQPPELAHWEGWPSEDQQCDEQGCWPRLFILGTQKGATTSLFQVLQREGVACGTKINEAVSQALPNLKGAFNHETGIAKEPHIFDIARTDWPTLMEQPGLYRSLYRVHDCPQRTFLDATPNYIHHPGAPGRLVELLPASWVPQLRMVLVMREPVARDLSWFNHRSASVGQDRSNMKYAFCSLSEADILDVNVYPTYEGEVQCRKQELDDCLKGARQRLNKGEGVSQKGHGQMALSSRVASPEGNGVLEEDYRECVEAAWHNGDGDNSPSWDEEDDTSALVPPLFTWGMYLPQIYAWSRRVLRNQILVLDFERLVARPDDVLPRVTSFMGLPTLRSNVLPHENEQPYARKVDVISCETSRILYGAFREANDQLVRAMREDHERGHAPSQEPLFEGFNTTVPCEEQEHVWLEEQEQEA